MTAINWTNITDFGQLPAQANNVSSFNFWVAVIFLIFIVLFIMLIGYGFEVAILISGFLAMVLSILLVYADLIPWFYILFFAALLLFMFLYIVWSSGRKT